MPPAKKKLEISRVEATLRAVLPPSAKIAFRPIDEFKVELKVAGQRFRAEWAGEGWLRQVQPLLTKRRERPDIVVARRMSPGAREALTQAGIGWVDELGAAEIAIGTVIVSQSGRVEEAPEKLKKWTPAVVAVAEALLCGKDATVSAAEESTGLSVGSCTNALRALTDLGFLEAQATRGRLSARKIVDFEKLLDAYAQAATTLAPSISLVVGVSWRDPVTDLAEIGKKWRSLGIEWAASGTVAAVILAPVLTTVTSANVYVDARSIADLNGIATKSGLRPIEGGRLTLMPFPTPTTRRLARNNGGLTIAPWPRVYADLRTVGVRGEDSAEHLREVMRGK